ncbi:hypothetical protein [Trichothermofontia sp.]
MTYTHWVYQFWPHCRVACELSSLTPQPTPLRLRPLASPTTPVVSPCPADPAAIAPSAPDRPATDGPVPTAPLDPDAEDTASLNPAYPDRDLTATYALERRIFL